MKEYIIALSCLVLFGCAGSNICTESNILETISAPPKTIPNQKCENVPAVKVFQVLDTFALATACKYSEYTNNLMCWGHTVYINKEKDKIYYDDQIIKPEDGKCIVYYGTYKYESKDKIIRTIPKIKFVKAEIENPEYKKYLKEKELNNNR